MSVRVQLTGSTWPGTARGGLPRYFADLFAALRRRTDLTVGATAFGAPEPGGSTWGPTRVRRGRACGRPVVPHRTAPTSSTGTSPCSGPPRDGRR